jgi:hypothetical protein
MTTDVRAVIELYTHGVFADSSFLDAYDRTTPTPPEENP